MSPKGPTPDENPEAVFFRTEPILEIQLKDDPMNKLSATLLATCMALGTVSAFAADEMAKDSMAKDGMAKDGMKKDSMTKDNMKKDSMAKDGMKKDAMAKDGVKKDSMGKDEMKK